MLSNDYLQFRMSLKRSLPPAQARCTDFPLLLCDCIFMWEGEGGEIFPCGPPPSSNRRHCWLCSGDDTLYRWHIKDKTALCLIRPYTDKNDMFCACADVFTPRNLLARPGHALSGLLSPHQPTFLSSSWSLPIGPHLLGPGKWIRTYFGVPAASPCCDPLVC